MEENTKAMQVDEQEQAGYIKQLHRVGTTTMLIILVITVIPTLYIYLACGGFPGWGVIAATFGALLAYNGFQWLMEAVVYFPMVGIAGSYICFTAGNILTMRVPCALAAQNAVNAKNGTLKGDAASVFGMAASVVVNFVCLGVVILFGNFLFSIMPDSMKVAFNYVMPALFGALLITIINMFTPKKHMKEGE